MEVLSLNDMLLGRAIEPSTSSTQKKFTAGILQLISKGAKYSSFTRLHRWGFY
jgi:hypothetical protein